MKKIQTAIIALAMGAMSPWVSAMNETDYVVTSDGQVWRTGFDECWHSSFNSPGDPKEECGDVVKQAQPAPSPAPAPAPVVEPEPAPAPVVEAPAPAPEPVVEAPKTTIVTLHNVRFETNSSVLTAESRPLLDRMVSQIKEDDSITRIDVNGHTDSRGAAAYNKKLSLDRAQAVVEYMAGKGITLPMYPAGKGEVEPIADNNTRDGRQRNRRVEFELYR